MKRIDFAFGPKDAGMEPLAETEQQPIKGVPASKAARLTADKMEWYADTGTSMDPIFDKRVALTLQVLLMCC